MPREDAHPGLYQAYGEALRALAVGEPQEVVLRRFELACFRNSVTALSWSPIATACPSGLTHYAYIIERGAVALDEHRLDDPMVVRGKTLIDMAHQDLPRS
jgi:DNA repair protein RecO (recombination protein O)